MKQNLGISLYSHFTHLKMVLMLDNVICLVCLIAFSFDMWLQKEEKKQPASTI